MAPTSNERREVASALRGDPNDTLIPQSRDGFEGMTYREAAYRFWNMCRRVRDAANVDIAYSTTSVLADLIDPTCKNKYRNHDDRSFLCSKCGYEAWTYGDSFCDPDEFRFCPHCGARVVNDDD